MWLKKASLQPVSVDSLPKVTQREIAYILSSYHPERGDEEDIFNNIFGLVDEPQVKAGTVQIDSITTTQHGTSVRQVEKLLDLLNQGIELTPIVISGNEVLDGHHRLQAYKEMGRSEVPAVDVTSLLNMDWERWIENDPTYKVDA